MPIDRLKLEQDAYSVVTQEILGCIAVPDDKPKDTKGDVIHPKYFPPIERPMQERANWWKTHGVVKDPDEKYPWYWAVAKQVKPLLICEIGLYMGYSAMAMAKGAIAGGVEQKPGHNVTVNGFDNEQYVKGSVEWCRAGFMEEGIACNFAVLDTQSVDNLQEQGISMINLFHVDGDHSEESCRHDLELAERSMVPRPGRKAYILVDDCAWTLGVRNAVTDFASKYKYNIHWLGARKGLALLERKK